MEIVASLAAIVVAFIALWVASDSLGRGERQYRALLDSHVTGLRKEIEKLGEVNQSAADEILRLQQQLADLRADLDKSEKTVVALTADIADVRKALAAQPASAVEGRRRA